jgi:hypothetical protein
MDRGSRSSSIVDEASNGFINKKPGAREAAGLLRL